MIKKKTFCIRRGFTLVEMMIVIAIIGLLALIAISSFGSANRSAKLDISVDTLVSIIRQQQGLAKSGKVDSSAGPADQGVYCYGVRFLTEAGKKEQVQLIKVPYVRLGTEKADYCEDITDKYLTGFTSVTEVIVKKINQSGAADSDLARVDFLFKPPFAGVIVIGPDQLIIYGNQSSDSAMVQNREVDIVIQSELSDEQEKIIFSPAGGAVHKEHITP